MGFSIAGLASTAQGYQQGMRQIAADESQARKDQRDQYQFEQEKRAQEEKARVDAILKGDEAGLSSAKPKTNGQRFMDSVAGLFSAKPKAEQPSPNATLADAAPAQTAPADSAEAQRGAPGLATTQSNAGIGATPATSNQHNASGAPMSASTPSLAQPAAQPTPKPAAKIPYYQQAQERLDAYAEKNPHDIETIRATQAQIDARKKGDADKAHAEFLKHGENAIQKFIASGDVSGIKEVMSKHWPDGRKYDVKRNKDGGYDVLDEEGNVLKSHKNEDSLGVAFSNLLHPEVFTAQYLEGQKTKINEEAKLPSQIALDKAKTDGEIRKAGETGVTAEHKATTAKLWAEAKKASSEMTAGGKPHTTDAMANYTFIKQNNLAPKGTSDEDIWAMANTAKTNGNEQLIVTPDSGYLTYNHATGRITKTTEDGAVTEQRPAQRGAASQVGANQAPAQPQVATGGAKKLW